jgi:hypothetical protein
MAMYSASNLYTEVQYSSCKCTQHKLGVWHGVGSSTCHTVVISRPLLVASYGHLALVVAAVEAKGNVTCTPVQIINIEVKDNHEEATLGAFLILQICEMVRVTPVPAGGGRVGRDGDLGGL